MRFFHKFFPLSLCVILLLGGIGPAYAREEPLQGRVYHALDDSPYQVDFNREINFDRITLRFGDDNLYWGDGAEDYDTFALLWDQAEFDAAVGRGETEFTMTGEYGLSEWSSAELAELWKAGLVTMPEPPELLVHIRPRDYVTVYSIPDEETVWNVHGSTTFEEATQYQDTVALHPAEGENPYDDPLTVDFGVTWNQEEYEAGMESGAESFSVSGVYGGPDWDAMKGWVRAEGSASARVVVERSPAQPLVYRDPAGGDLGGMSCASYVTPDTRFDELSLPAERALRLVGGTYQDARDFAVVWNREEFEAGMASGEDSFPVSGRYAPHNLWPPEEQQWWTDGRIRVDAPAPEATIHVLRDEKFPFTADVRINYYGDLGPYFIFPWVAGMESVTLAYSLDNALWHQEVWTWDELPSDQRQSGQAELAMIAMDEDDNPVITRDTDTVYVKMTVTGSSLAGTTEVYDLKSSDTGWDMTPHDDSGGDHGGGGQGEHDRPGKVDPDDPPPDPVPSPNPEPDPSPDPSPNPEPDPSPDPDPDPEPPSDAGDPSKPEPGAPSDSDDASRPNPIWPLPVWPVRPLVPEAVPTPSPAPTPAPAPAPVVTAPGPGEEPSVPADLPMREEPSAPPSAGGGKASVSADATRTAPAAAASRETAPAPSEKPAEEPAPERPTPVPAPESVPEPQPDAEAVPAVQAAHVPGFAAATAVTAALVLCGAAWFHWRGKRKQ